MCTSHSYKVVGFQTLISEQLLNDTSTFTLFMQITIIKSFLSSHASELLVVVVGSLEMGSFSSSLLPLNHGYVRPGNPFDVLIYLKTRHF